jgi:hypothetical protein
MAKNGEPVVLELASLPREQSGPFLLLGLDKTADKEKMESNWADRVRWARKGQLKVPLEDVNWARDVLRDLEARLRADAASLNVDLTEAVLARLALRFGVGGRDGGLRWTPLDREKALEGYDPPAEVPDPAEVAAAVTPPEVPDELPAVRALLDQLTAAPLDPWALGLPAPGEPVPPTAEETPP